MVFLALKEFQDLCLSQIVLIAMGNTTVVAYINKGGGMNLDPLYALLWRILTWCFRKQGTLKARHIPNQLNMTADKLSRLGQTIQTELYILPEVSQIHQMAPASSRSVFNEVQQQIASVCVTGSRPPSMCSASTLPVLGGSGPQCLPTSGYLGQSGDIAGLPITVSLRQWEHEWRLLRESQPDQSMKKSGPFLQSGATAIRWTSGHPYKVLTRLPDVSVPGQEGAVKYY